MRVMGKNKELCWYCDHLSSFESKWGQHLCMPGDCCIVILIRERLKDGPKIDLGQLVIDVLKEQFGIVHGNYWELAGIINEAGVDSKLGKWFIASYLTAVEQDITVQDKEG